VAELAIRTIDCGIVAMAAPGYGGPSPYGGGVDPQISAFPGVKNYSSHLTQCVLGPRKYVYACQMACRDERPRYEKMRFCLNKLNA